MGCVGGTVVRWKKWKDKEFKGNTVGKLILPVHSTDGQDLGLMANFYL